MKQQIGAGLAAASFLILAAAPAVADAKMIAPPSIPERVALADAVVVGKVTAFGDKLVSARPPSGGDKVDYQIAVVRVSDAVAGVKEAKEIKVAFVPPSGDATGPGPIRRRYPQFQLTLGQEACLLLVKHPTEDFFVGLNYYDVIPKADNPDFEKNMEEVQRAARLLADPPAGLKAKDAGDRFLTAALLIVRYRTPRGGETAEEPVDAGLSKQILQTLADADWAAKPPPTAFRLTPQAIFFRLGATPDDGWKQPPDAGDIADAAKRWLRDNADKYRIRRFVAETKEDKKDGK